jgi:hypothetical protein
VTNLPGGAANSPSASRRSSFLPKASSPKIAETSKAASSPSSNVTNKVAIERPFQRQSISTVLSYTFSMLSRQSLLRAARTAAPRQSAVLTQTRSFASPASGSDNVKPPVAVYGLDGTYATALVR